MSTPPVPVIDVSRPLDGQLPALDAACRDHGFFLIAGHGLDQVVDATWEAARRFFGGDRAVKLGVQRDGVNPLGWYDRELTKRLRDHKEVFDFVDPDFPLADRTIAGRLNRTTSARLSVTSTTPSATCRPSPSRSSIVHSDSIPQTAFDSRVIGPTARCGSITTPWATRYRRRSEPTSVSWV